MAGDSPTNHRTGFLFLGFLGVLALGFWCYSLWNSTPQMGPDPVLFKAVDALYSAVRNKDLPRINACEKQLALSRENGTLPGPSFQVLMDIIRKTREDQWQSASESLYYYMLAQHR